MRLPTIPVAEGFVIGELTIGPLVTPKDFTLQELIETSPSYLSHGSLHRCFCSCGSSKVVSRYVLERGLVKSCGHLRRAQLANAQVKREAKIAKQKELGKLRELYQRREYLKLKLAAESQKLHDDQDQTLMKEIWDELVRVSERIELIKPKRKSSALERAKKQLEDEEFNRRLEAFLAKEAERYES